jgi:hypothetical protein
MNQFLTAHWQDLIMANYEVAPDLLTTRVPAGTELDLHDGKCFVSLVGFMFRDTRVKGFPIPFHINFEEVNLRFYVRRENGDEVRRGVVFVKEIVPRRAIATVARVIYGEPYECWQMSHERTKDKVRYQWSRKNFNYSLTVTVGENLGVPPSGSHGEFIIEHYWGYTKRSESRTDEYKVEHPKWELFSVKEESVAVDFGAIYGDDFQFLNNEKPYSVLLAKGSEVAVYRGQKLTGE